MEFIKYEHTPEEKHFGIATVKLYGKILLRYKIIPNKDNSSFFSVPSSYKVQLPDGTCNYLPAFLVDSRAEDEEINSLIKKNVKPLLCKQESSSQTKSIEIKGDPIYVTEEIPF